MGEVILKVLKGEGEIPQYQTEHSAGMDLHSAEEVTILAGRMALIDTGIKIAIPEGFEGQVRPRSGLAAKHGITVLNAPGTIDADYRGPVKVILINLSDQLYKINVGDRIAQLVIAKYEKVEIEEVEVLDDTDRGSGGMGSTGK